MEANTHHQKTSPRDFFLHLFATAALYFSAVNVIALLREYVNYFFPDPLQYAYGNGFSNGMRLAVAFLIVIFPAYVITMWILGRDVDRTPAKRDLWVRRWSIHLTLFLSGVTIIGDLVYLVYSFLGGDLTIRFILQALAILIVAVAVFAYYIYILRRAPGASKPTRMALVIGSLIVVGALIVGAFFIIGSPSANRDMAFDQQRVNDLLGIQQQVVQYWQQKETLPNTLDELNDPLSSFIAPNDPATKAPYEYRKTGDLAFELCATFFAPFPQDADGKPSLSPAYAYTDAYAVQTNFQHMAGRQCFARTIDPQLYPPFNTPQPLIKVPQ